MNVTPNNCPSFYYSGEIIQFRCYKQLKHEQHPTTHNPMVRLNVLQSIRCCIKNKQSNWNFHLEQQIAGAIRATENRQTNFTPNLLLLRRETTQSKDLMLRTNKKKHSRERKFRIYTRSKTNMEECHQMARENIIQQSTTQTKMELLHQFLPEYKFV